MILIQERLMALFLLIFSVIFDLVLLCLNFYLNMNNVLRFNYADKFFIVLFFLFLFWTFPVFFYFTTSQQKTLHRVFCYNLKLAYGFANWSDHFFFSITGEYTLLDRLFRYWRRFEVALMTGPDTLGFAHQ
jgi:hypothetical protein